MALRLILKRAFTAPTRNAIHIYPLSRILPKNSPVKEIMGVKLPIMEKVPRMHSPKVRPTAHAFDDRIAANHIKITLGPNRLTHSENLRNNYIREVQHPFIIGDKPKSIQRTYTFTTEELQTSCKKAKPIVRVLIGRYYYDAIVATQNLQTKVAKFLNNQFEKQMTNKITEANFDPRYMFVTSIVMNRTRRIPKIRYHARGKSGRAIRDYCKFKITVTERPIQEFFRMILQGKAPGYLAYMVRDYLLNKDANYEEVRQLQLFLTARGRQQQRLMFKRKVLAKWLEYKEAGRFIRIRYLKDIMLEQEVAEFERKYKWMFPLPHEEREARLEERQAKVEALLNQ